MIGSEATAMFGGDLTKGWSYYEEGLLPMHEAFVQFSDLAPFTSNRQIFNYIRQLKRKLHFNY